MASQPVPRVSPEEYLAAEANSEVRHEFMHGEVFAMAGATIRHCDIVGNLQIYLGQQLRNTGCRARSVDLRVRTSHEGLYTYPDLVISCGDEVSGTTLLNPKVIVEVLSDETEGCDRGKKFELYRTISSFQEYLIVAQDRVYVEHHGLAGDGTWQMTEYRQLAQSIKLQSVPVVLPLKEVYFEVYE